MPKPKVIRNEKVLRNDAAHQVRLRDGSDVAESRDHEARGPADLPADAVSQTASVLVKARAEQRVKAPPASESVVRPKTKLRRAAPQIPVEEPVFEEPPPPPVARPVLPQPVYKPLRAAVMAVPPAEPSAPLPKPETLWKPGSTMVQRMSNLRNRNAKVQEQLQRLRRPYGTEGK